MKKLILIAALIVFMAAPGTGLAANITLDGDTGARINFKIEKTVTTVPGLQNLTLGFVVPESFTSPAYSQEISGFDLKFTPPPADQKSRTDNRGNRIVTATWKIPPESVNVELSFSTTNNNSFTSIDTSAPFPLKNVPEDVAAYLKATPQVQANDARVRDLAAQLVADVHTEFAAVEHIISFVVDYISYITFPEKYDALYSLATGKGNCQNFSHLSAALLRASGIPVRIVNGVTLNKPLNITRDKSVLTYKMAQGYHSWIEIWFPDLGWVPFDPQQTAMFVLNRFIRIETGIDNNETINNGLVRWSRAKDTKGEPRIQEVIHADFVEDKVALNGRQLAKGPKSFLLFPMVKAEAKIAEISVPQPPLKAPEETKKVAVVEPPPASASQPETTKVGLPEPPPDTTKKGFFGNIWLAVKSALGMTKDDDSSPSFFSRIKEQTRIVFKAEKGSLEESPLIVDGIVTLGNIEFPENIDFAFPPTPTVPTSDNSFEKTRSFLVETAEFVTSKRTQYAQVFILAQPVTLEKIGLALHKFGGDGQLWIDVCRDNAGKPGEVIATSNIIELDSLSERPGYRWTDFPFSEKSTVLAPGNYWIALGFSGSPVVNWFYTYGKPVGPAEGTRYKGIFDNEWSGALSYEFNYRVAGVLQK